MILDPMGFRGPQRAGPIRHGRRSSLGRWQRNQETIPPPERSRRDREGSR